MPWYIFSGFFMLQGGTSIAWGGDKVKESETELILASPTLTVAYKEFGAWTPELIQAIKHLWADEDVQLFYSVSTAYQLDISAE